MEAHQRSRLCHHPHHTEMTMRKKTKGAGADARACQPAAVDDDFLMEYFGVSAEPEAESRPPNPRRAAARRKVPKPADTPMAQAGPRRRQGRQTAAAHSLSKPATCANEIGDVAEHIGANPSITPVKAPSRKAASEPDQDVTALVAPVHQAALGAGRVARALVEFAREAGQRLAEARELVGVGNFDCWVHTTLAISPPEATAFIDFATDAAVANADVSPCKAMTLTQVLDLVARLGDCLRHEQS